MRKAVDIQGMTTTAAYKDGDCVELVNLRKKNGVLRPVMPRGVKFEISGNYSRVFSHQLPTGGTTWVGVSEDGKTLTLIATETEAGVVTQVRTTIATLQGAVKDIVGLGNYVCLSTAEGLEYFIWRNGSYTHIDGNFRKQNDERYLDLPEVTFKCVAETTHTTDGKFALNYLYADVNEPPAIQYKEEKLDSSSYKINLKLFQEQMAQLVGYANRLGFTINSRLVCYAYKLYNGDIVGQRFCLLNAPGSLFNKYYNEQSIMLTNFIGGTGPFYVSKDGDLRGSIYGIAEEVTGGWGPLERTKWPAVFYRTETTEGTTTKRMYAPMGKILCSIGNVDSTFSKYEGMIDSLRIYMSDDIEIFTREDGTVNGAPTGVMASLIYLKLKTESELNKTLEDLDNLYLIKEVKYDEIKYGEVDLDLTDLLGENLHTKDALKVDWKYSKFVPECIGQYNGRISIANYSERYFGGFGVDEFKPTCKWLGYNKLETLENTRWHIRVQLSDQTHGNSYVFRHYNLEANPGEFDVTLGSFLYYPDSRARKMDIYIKDGTRFKKYSFKLTSNEAFNISFYVEPTLQNIVLSTRSYVYVDSIGQEENVSIDMPNVLKVSSLNNPMYFADENTEMIGSGVIRWMAANAQPVATQNSGAQPMFVGTSEGVHALIVNQSSASEAVFSGSHGVSNVACVSDKHRSTTSGVVFMGKRGAYVVESHGCSLMSVQLEEEIEQGVGVRCDDIDSFAEFAEYLKTILFDTAEDEVIFVADGYGYNYVFNMPSKTWYVSYEAVAKEVGGCYPHLYALEKKTGGYKVKDFGAQGGTEQDCHLVTRPMMVVGGDESKKVGRVKLRCTLVDARKSARVTAEPTYGVYRSMDNRKVKAAARLTMKEGMQKTLKDLTTGQLVECVGRSFVVEAAAKMKEGSRIDYIEIDLKGEYADEGKMR